MLTFQSLQKCSKIDDFYRICLYDFQQAIVKFVGKEIETLEELEKTVDNNDKILFLINIRRGVFGYLHEKEGEINPIETDVVNALRFVDANLKNFGLLAEDVEVVIDGDLGPLMFDVLLKIGDLEILQAIVYQI